MTLFIRHAESYENIKGKICEELEGEQLSACCSPFVRARQTLQEILHCMEKEDIKVVEYACLKEIDLDEKLSVLRASGGEFYEDV